MKKGVKHRKIGKNIGDVIKHEQINTKKNIGDVIKHEQINTKKYR